jgi:hypothetical protein
MAALIMESVWLCFWPTVYLSDSGLAPSRLGEVVLHRHPELGAVLWTLKALVDAVFPGVLWSGEQIVVFLFHCLIVAFAAYAALAWRLVGVPSLPLRWIIAPLLVFQVTLAVIPASMTTDIFNYALYGEMPILYGANPFVSTPSEFPQSPLYYLIPLYWHDAPSVYGPLWVAISTGVAALFRSFPLADEVLFYRGIANVAHLGNTLLVWMLARRIDAQRAPTAAIAYGWNPLALVEFSFNGHNDVLMLTFVLGALLATTSRRVLVAAVLLGCSVATKYTSILIAPILLLWGAFRLAPGVTPRDGLRTFLISAALVGVVPAVLYAPWFEGVRTFGPVLHWMSGPVQNNFWPEPMLVGVARWIAAGSEVPYETAWDWVLTTEKLVAKVGLAALIAFEALRTRSLDDVLASSTRVTLVFLLVVTTWVMPWYYIWPLAMCAALGWNSALVRVCAGLTLTAAVAMYQRQMGFTVVGESPFFLVLPILLAAIPWLLARLPLGRWSPSVGRMAPQQSDAG